MSRRASAGAIRRVIFICLIYAVVTVILVVWSRRAVQDAAWEVMESTAKLIGQEIASTMSESVRERLGTGGGTDQEIHDTILRLAERSETVRFATIIGSRGEVVATNDPEASAALYSAPSEIFGQDLRPRIEVETRSSLKRGEFLVEIPFVRAGDPYAYLRLSMMSANIAGLYRSSYIGQLVTSAVGLITIGALALFLHLQHEKARRRHADRLAALLSGEADGGDLADPSFRPALEAADRLRAALADGELRAKEARQQLRQLDRALEVGVVITDSAGRPRMAGEKARQLLGISDDVDGHQGAEALPGGLEAVAAEVSETGESKTISLEQAADGGGHGVEIHVIPLDSHNGGSVMLQIRDRERVRALEQNLLEAARLRGLTRLYLGVAHDLRAPINAMILNLANLKDSLESGEALDPATDLRTIVMLEDELSRLQRAVESVLNQTAPVNTQAATFDLRELIEDLEFLLKAQARQQRVQLEVQLPREEILVTAQRDWIKQAVLNLVVNAFEATPAGGHVTIDVRTARGWAEIVVADTGPGLPDAMVTRLFEMHATTKEGGTGIGLYVARIAVESAGGSLALVRTGPDGTTFEIRLPEREEGFVGDQA